MAGRGPAPKENSRTRHKPLRGSWKPTPGLGWQHGAVPDPPTGMCAPALAAWAAWMQSWTAAHWTANDLPGLRVTVQLLDQCERYFEDPYIEKETRKGDSIFVLRPNPVSELRQMMDNYGITPKGQQDRRWAAPKPEDIDRPKAEDDGDPYRRLRAV